MFPSSMSSGVYEVVKMADKVFRLNIHFKTIIKHFIIRNMYKKCYFVLKIGNYINIQFYKMIHVSKSKHV